MLDRPAGSASATPPSNRGRTATDDRPEPRGDELSPRLLLAALRRRRVALLANILLWPLFAFIAVKQVAPTYTATGSLVYEPSEYKVRELQSVLQVDPTTEAVMASQAEILCGLHVVQRVAERGNLYDNPEFNSALRPHGHVQRAIEAVHAWFAPVLRDGQTGLTGPTHDATRDATLLTVQAAFEAHTVKTSRVLEVSFTARDPQVAATAVNNAMDIYIKDQYAAKHRAVDRATEWLDKRSAELRKDVHDGEDRIAAYRASQGLAQGMHAGMDAEEISNLAEDLVHARTALGNAEAKLDAARGRAGAAAQAAIAPSVVQLRALEDQISAQIQSQQGRLGSNHPEALGLQRQYADAQRAVAAEIARVVAATEAELRAARERVATLEQDLRNGEQAADRSAAAQVALNAMQRDVDASRQQLQAVLDSVQRTGQQAAIEFVGGARDLARIAAGPAELPAHRAADGRFGRVRSAGRHLARVSAGTGRYHAALRRSRARGVRPAVLRAAAGDVAPPGRPPERGRVCRAQAALAVRRASADVADRAMDGGRTPACDRGDGGPGR